MNCFELVKDVLDEEYNQMPGTEVEKDERINQALTRLSEHYRRVSTTGPGDYRKRSTRFAYIYRYTTAHANLLYQRINSSGSLQKLFDRDFVEISCIGGGPGSDYLGILKYLMHTNKKPKLRCNLFDREPAWIESWSDVDQKIESEIRLSLPFITIDVTDQDSWKPHTKYFKSDLFTFVYFMSEVYKYESKADEYFNTLLSRAKPGAFFLFIDNNASDHYGWFDRLASENNLEIIKESRGKQQMPWDEEKKSLGCYFEKFPNPKLDADIAFRLARKPGG